METEKLYSPLHFHLHDKEAAEQGRYDESYYWSDPIDHEEAYMYMDAIELAVRRDRDTMDKELGLAEYVPDSLRDVVVSLFPNIELHGDKLWCVADVALSRPITPGEIAELADWWEGQLSDGWGEGFEQREIKVDRGELYIEPWSSDDSFFIMTQKEFDWRMEPRQPLPETPAQAALHEPDIYEDEATAALRQQLIERLDANLTAYFEDLYGDAGRNVTGMSAEIAAVAGAHCYLTEVHNFHTSEIEYLLRFQDPLRVVADAFEASGMDNRSDIMWDIFDRQVAHLSGYPLVSEPPDMDVEAMMKTLQDRLDENFADMINDLRSDIADTMLSNAEAVAIAERITAINSAYDYLSEASLSGEQVEYLLNFQYPLEVIANRWPVTLDGLMDMQDVVADILEDGDLHDDYAKVSDVDAPAAKEAARSDAEAEKPSVLEQIRQAREDAQHAPVPRREHTSKEHEPER